MDRQLITRGLNRCSTGRFLLWIAPWIALLLFGLYSAGLCLVKGMAALRRHLLTWHQEAQEPTTV